MLEKRQRVLLVLHCIAASAVCVLGVPFAPASWNWAYRSCACVHALCAAAALGMESCFRSLCRVCLISHSLGVFLAHALGLHEIGVFIMAVMLESCLQIGFVDVLLNGSCRTLHVALTLVCALSGHWIGQDMISSDSTARHTGDSASETESRDSEPWAVKLLTLACCSVAASFFVGRISVDDIRWCRSRRRVHSFHDDSLNMPVIPTYESSSTVVDVDGTDSVCSSIQQAMSEVNGMSIHQLRHLAASMRKTNDELSTILVTESCPQLIGRIRSQVRNGSHDLRYVPAPDLYKLAMSMGGADDVSFLYNETMDPQRHLFCWILHRRQLQDSATSFGTEPAAQFSTSQPFLHHSGRQIQVDAERGEYVFDMWPSNLLPGQNDSADGDKETSNGDDGSDVMTAWSERERLRASGGRRELTVGKRQLSNLYPEQERAAEEEDASDNRDRLDTMTTWKLWRFRNSVNRSAVDSEAQASRTQACGLISRGNRPVDTEQREQMMTFPRMSSSPPCQDDAVNNEAASADGDDSVVAWESVHTSQSSVYANVLGKILPW